MKRIRLWPAALLGLAALAVPAAAQPGGRPPSSTPPADMQENIEILRRLLDGAYAEAYGVPGGKSATPPVLFGAYSGYVAPGAPHGPDHPAPHTEGVYLKDYGVVYTATLPPPGFDPMPASKPGIADKPPDEWDRVRKEIRGEKPEQQVQPVPGHRPLSEVILKVLADNGKHFTGLADGERLTVTVTFRGAANCANCHQNPWQLAPQTNPAVPYYNFLNTATPTPGGPATPDLNAGLPQPDPKIGAPGQPPATDGPAWLNDVRNDELLGDLHAKQGKTTEAIAAYEKAEEQVDKALARKSTTEMGVTKADVPVLLAAIAVRYKLAAAYRQAGVEGSANKVLLEAADLAKQAAGFSSAPVTANPQPAAPPPALPAKLIVTASGKQLGEVGSGKMTFEEFCKAATVEYVNPPADKK